jgi:error-prone DNA polymerase
VAVRPADVTVSGWDCTLEGESRPALRLGLRLVAGLSAEAGAAIERARAEAPFRDIPDLVHRARLDRAAMQALARADALRSLAPTRRHALWEAAGIEKPLPLAGPRDDAAPLLPKETAGEETVLDYAATGLSLRRHPLALLRPKLSALGAADTRALNAARRGRWMRVPGLVLVRQRPGSAKGVVFFTIEDEWGIANLVLYTDIVQRDRAAVVNAKLVLAEGPVERTENTEVPIIHLITRRLHDWSHLLEGLHALEDPAAWDKALARADEVRHASGEDPRTVRAALRARAAIPPSRDFR